MALHACLYLFQLPRDEFIARVMSSRASKVEDGRLLVMRGIADYVLQGEVSEVQESFNWQVGNKLLFLF